MRLLVIQHDRDVPPGLLAEWAAERGVELVSEEPADAIVSLGSYASVTDGAYADEMPLLRAAAEEGRPVVGICFGAQLLAKALGGDVVRLDTPEATWDDVAGEGPFLLLHEDAIVAPPGADEVVDGPLGVRAFRKGTAVGVQHHPEVTPEIVAGWAATSDIPERAGVDVDALIAIPDGAREAAFALFDRLLLS